MSHINKQLSIPTLRADLIAAKRLLADARKYACWSMDIGSIFDLNSAGRNQWLIYALDYVAFSDAKPDVLPIVTEWLKDDLL